MKMSNRDRDYRSSRDLKRERSRTPPRRERSRSPPRRERARSPDARGDRGRDSRDYKDSRDSRDSRNQSRDTHERDVNRLNTSSKAIEEDHNRSFERRTIPSSTKPTSRAAIEQAKKDRLELVKKLTNDGDVVEKHKAKKQKVVFVNEDGVEEPTEEMEEDEDEEDMMEMMGFAGFNTTKGKQIKENVFGAASGAVAKHKERKYRQYMNRRGGFNRPLQKMD